ncbi:MAG TPA: terminase TerL endonuclease subunit [Vicinamibacterales bacterium]|nr:terminase TerL endonuclease subunit [Vicinamibacterales bacterium]
MGRFSSAKNSVDAYAMAVVAGRVPAGRYHRLACERHLFDRRREGSRGFPFRFIWEPTRRGEHSATRFLSFARRVKHYKGEWAGRYFEPSDNQVFRLGSIFGWRHAESGLRRFTTAYNEIPRKGGKTFEAAIVALYGTFFEGEAGAEGYCIATKREQARRVFDDAKRMVVSSGLKSRIKVNAANLCRDDLACKLEPLGADADSTDGLNPHVIITDEFHAHKTRALIDVMESATGARRNPLHFQITTAGNDPVSPCGDQHEYVTRILDGVLDDDPATLSMFAFIAHADEADDWREEATWRKANPHYDISVKPDDMRKLAAKAIHMPSAAAEFQQKRLNIWVNASAPWLSLDGWRKGQTQWSPDDVLGEECYLGLDLASKIDLCALVALFPPTPSRESWRILPFAWTPKDTLVERAHRDRAPYDIWAQQGYLLTVPGEKISQALVREKILDLKSRYRVRAIGYDDWHMDQLDEQLVEEDGLSRESLVVVPQTYAGMSSACLRFEAEVLGGHVDAGDSPLMAWCASNVVVQRDGKDNIYPVKKRSRGRIDPIVAANIAMACYLKQPVVSGRKKSIYATRLAEAVMVGDGASASPESDASQAGGQA